MVAGGYKYGISRGRPEGGFGWEKEAPRGGWVWGENGLAGVGKKNTRGVGSRVENRKWVAGR